jgi:hypothetical protein
LNHLALKRISGKITIPAPTAGNSYTTTVLDFSSQVPTDMNIVFHIIRLEAYILPFYDYYYNTRTFVYTASYTNRNLTIASNTTAWNNSSYTILLIFNR